MSVGTVTYTLPVAGTVAPTAAQAAACNMVAGTVNFLDADTTATITHNFAATAAQLAALFPMPVLYQTSGGTPSPLLTVTLATNTVVLTKQSTAAGTGGTLNFALHRPHSILASA